MVKKYLETNVFDAAKERISKTFDNFKKIYVSCSFGKDSTVMLHLVMDEAIKRGRKVGVMFVDLEAQYKLTIEHGEEIVAMYKEHIEMFWISLPLHLRNAVSQYQPFWICWESGREKNWVRVPPKMAITDQKYFDFFKYSMEFEEFVPKFGKWYGDDERTACFVGIRADESYNRFRTIASETKTKFLDWQWSTKVIDELYNIYPIYDWRTEDIWKFQGASKLPYNRLYDRMYQAGLTIHQMRICQPYGDDQRRGLWLYHVIEPETWGKVVARVNGANYGSLYAQESGNILGVQKITLPPGHTWQSFAMLLLDTLPPTAQEHYKNKFAIFIKWYEERGYDEIPDTADRKEEANRTAPSWRRICKALLRNDYWCKGLSFTQHKSASYEKYKERMKKRREKWNLLI